MSKHKRKKVTMSIYSEILNKTSSAKTLTIEEEKKVQSLKASLSRHDEALQAALDACNKITNEADKIEALGSVKAEYLRSVTDIRKEIECITGTPTPLSESVMKLLNGASQLTINISGNAGSLLGKVIKTPAKSIGGFFKNLAKEIEG